MATLRIDLEVRDFDMWRDAFGKDAGGRGRHGARGHRIFRAVGDDRRVTLDIDFDTPSEADAFLTVLRNDVWSSSDKAPQRSARRRRRSSTWLKATNTADPADVAAGLHLTHVPICA